MSLAHLGETSSGSKQGINEEVGDSVLLKRNCSRPIDLPESTTDWKNMIRQINMKESK
jgi:hypothetical protein